MDIWIDDIIKYRVPNNTIFESMIRYNPSYDKQTYIRLACRAVGECKHHIPEFVTMRDKIRILIHCRHTYHIAYIQGLKFKI